MASPTKEEQLLRLILENSPLKHWHFEEFIKQTSISRAALNKWLHRYQKDGLIKRIKEKSRFPYFTAGMNNQAYQSKKRVYMLTKLYQSGLIDDLMRLEKARTIILFGSIARGDWYKDSDIDIFIFGNTGEFKKYKYELDLKRNIELHVFETKKEIKEVKTGLIKNIINGYIIKGEIQDFAEVS
ncbi:MAG: nucleotidyltransferase domain-containing protein [Nanoarchaeota archaeon]|nr:nucleotidyltransferase domain-containing protein [Nanoarchaeota archaeon]MBU1005689.1 nucleotidyltransferase domain-containing protein [Nanoarchaeota archaeon]MBU1946180.1 nucleotidyltransferase domain-containing protein [Nanoarchaeota archaeon]